MSLLSSHRDEHKMSVPLNAFLRSITGIVASVAFLIGIIIDVTYSQAYLSNFVGVAVGWVLSIGVGSAFEIIGTATLMNRERMEALTNFERILVYAMWVAGYAFDIITNFMEMLALSAPYLANKTAPEHIIAYVVIGISAVFLAFCEYIFAISLVFAISNTRVWWTPFWDWLPNVGKDSKQDRADKYQQSRLP